MIGLESDVDEPIAVVHVYEWEILLDGWIFWLTSAFFLFELMRLAVRKALEAVGRVSPELVEGRNPTP